MPGTELRLLSHFNFIATRHDDITPFTNVETKAQKIQYLDVSELVHE